MVAADIGRAKVGMTYEWFLVEAKANAEEMRSHCGAADGASRAMIERSLNATKAALGVEATRDWTTPYYQFCNRPVALHFLNINMVPARMIYTKGH